MANLTKASLTAALKELFRGKELTSLAYDKTSRPFLSMLEKDESIEGKYVSIPVLYEDTQGLGPTFATSQSNTTAPALKQFQVTTVADYNIGRVDGVAIRLSKSDKGAIVRAVDLAMKSAINGLSNRIETQLFRTSGGSIGQTTETTGTTITLVDSRDVNNFSVGMKIVFAAGETSALRASGTALTVSAVDRVAGTLTTSANLSTITSLAASDYIFREGAYVSASDALNISGLASWVPSSAPGATAFFGVDRSVDSRLGGFRYDGTGMTIEEALTNGAALVSENGSGAPDVALVSFNTYRNLTAELSSKVLREPGKLGKAGFSAISIAGPRGVIEVVPCAKCQTSVAWLLDLSTWTLLSAGPVVQVIDEDGMEWRAVYNDDAFEIRVGFFGNLACSNPGGNARVSL